MSTNVRTRTPIMLCTDGDAVVEVWQSNGEYFCTCDDMVIDDTVDPPVEPKTCRHIDWVEQQVQSGFWRYTFDGPEHDVRADSPEALRDWLLTHLHVFEFGVEIS